MFGVGWSLLVTLILHQGYSTAEDDTKPSTEPPPIVNISLGQIKGVRYGGYDAYKGIRYGVPPTKKLRFKVR